MGGAPTIGSIFAERVVVGVGDMAVSNNANVTISTYALGSCVGIVALDPMAQVGGMLHIMLPDSTLTPEKAAKQPSMFADTGMRAFMRALYGLKADRRRMRLFLAGGANVLSGSDFFKIGERNITAVRAFIQRERLSVVSEELGGLNNRTLHFKIKDGIVEMKLPSGLKHIRLV
ncbi:MAG: chemotaxis protein CheD [Opitutales bacterium]|nr:chemotaxis protein CheD [Opitutales bacterium]